MPFYPSGGRGLPVGMSERALVAGVGGSWLCSLDKGEEQLLASRGIEISEWEISEEICLPVRVRLEF